ncbi:hypothetical protein Q3G72_024923 [Acer saccharum]|nr:hypothetical protein Q3G72_024923 [Acer saccharum]
MHLHSTSISRITINMRKREPESVSHAWEKAGVFLSDYRDGLKTGKVVRAAVIAAQGWSALGFGCFKMIVDAALDPKNAAVNFSGLVSVEIAEARVVFEGISMARAREGSRHHYTGYLSLVFLMLGA